MKGKGACVHVGDLEHRHVHSLIVNEYGVCTMCLKYCKLCKKLYKDKQVKK